MTVTTAPGATDAHASRVLNSLIAICNDGARVQAAAALVFNGTRRSALEDGSSRRKTFVSELSAEVRALGGTPNEGGSAGESVRALAHQVNAMVIGENGGDAYTNCARVEARAEKLYKHALDGNLPERARTLVTSHFDEIVADHAALRLRSMGG